MAYNGRDAFSGKSRFLRCGGCSARGRPGRDRRDGPRGEREGEPPGRVRLVRRAARLREVAGRPLRRPVRPRRPRRRPVRACAEHGRRGRSAVDGEGRRDRARRGRRLLGHQRPGAGRRRARHRQDGRQDAVRARERQPRGGRRDEREAAAPRHAATPDRLRQRAAALRQAAARDLARRLLGRAAAGDGPLDDRVRPVAVGRDRGRRDRSGRARGRADAHARRRLSLCAHGR